MRAIAFGLLFVGLSSLLSAISETGTASRIDVLLGVLWTLILVGTVVCIIGGW